MSNLTEHKCAGKCPEFKGEQCHHCLIQQIEKREFELGVAPDSAYVKCGTSQVIDCTGISSKKVELQFKVGDVVVTTSPEFNDDLLIVTLILDKPHLLHPCAFLEDPKGEPKLRGFPILRHATPAELKAKKRLMTNPICPYCNKESDGVDGTAIYPHRPDLSHKWFYQCVPCDAYVGCHPGTKNSLGRLANAELRKWKSIAHRVFDPLWRDGHMKRKEAYKALAEVMNIHPNDCHIGMFDVDQCKKVYSICMNEQIKKVTS